MDKSFLNLTTFPGKMLTLAETLTRELGDEPASWIGGWMTRQNIRTGFSCLFPSFLKRLDQTQNVQHLSRLILPHQKIPGSADCKKEGDQDLIDLQDRKDHSPLSISPVTATQVLSQIVKAGDPSRRRQNWCGEPNTCFMIRWKDLQWCELEPWRIGLDPDHPSQTFGCF